LYYKILRNLIRGADSDHLSLIKDINAVTNTRDEVQVMVHDENACLDESRYFSDPVDHLLRLEVTHAASRFIKQQISGGSRGRPGKLETPSIPIVQFTGPPMSEFRQATGTNQEFNVRLPAAARVPGRS
jgi:hypothetical protein